MLWYLPFLALCRLVAGTAALLEPKGRPLPLATSTLLGLAALALHVWRWGRPPLGAPFEHVDFFLEDCKVRQTLT